MPGPHVEGWKDVADIAQSVATVLAILVGGYWTWMFFVSKRGRFPRADIKHNISHRPFANGKVVLSVSVIISNNGDVLLSLVSLETRVQQVLPPPPNVLDVIETGGDPVKAGEGEVQWPELSSRALSLKKGEFEIEPGESDHRMFDFFIDEEVQTVEVYSYFKNVKKDGPIGWGRTTVYDIYQTPDRTTK
ncbi:MAG: hypothetical protein EXR60_01050 [Dehalococcoidia bacterium]|nr:hypothetical protein [Dehalococcoidia bacterium]